MVAMSLAGNQPTFKDKPYALYRMGRRRVRCLDINSEFWIMIMPRLGGTPIIKCGNGGFSLRSTALTRYLRKHRDKFPVPVRSIITALPQVSPDLENLGFFDCRFWQKNLPLKSCA